MRLFPCDFWEVLRIHGGRIGEREELVVLVLIPGRDQNGSPTLRALLSYLASSICIFSNETNPFTRGGYLIVLFPNACSLLRRVSSAPIAADNL